MVSSSFDPLLVGLREGTTPSQGLGSSSARIAQGFESLLVRQFLAAARATSILNDDGGSETGWREMGDDALAGYAAKHGGFGLAKQIGSLLEQAGLGRGPLDDVTTRLPMNPSVASPLFNVDRNLAVPPTTNGGVVPSSKPR
ncbi:MAG: hypothetical protein EBX30_10225 [Betaproteobacteria bacterium]|nr:hypothetical protein [Betaproteobacteria bacterium]NCY07554.1 hypothetical protein [Betaproteobacteria bacterium]NDE53042.1 hypothetical protein [Actinomycetota bacterium]